MFYIQTYQYELLLRLLKDAPFRVLNFEKDK